MRGTLVHSVLERLYDLPAAGRTVEAAQELVAPAWAELREEPGVADLFAVAQEDGAETDANAPESVETWLASAGRLVEKYFTLEDPTRIQPHGREELVEVTLPDGLLLRGYVDRLDLAPNGALRVVDYKTGSTPREAFEGKALFQMKFYALVLWRTRGVVASQLKLLYLGDGEALTYAPDEAELRPLRAHPAGHLGGDRAGRRHRRLPAQQDPAVRLVRPPGGLPGLGRHSPAVPARGRRRGRLADHPAGRRARLRPHARPPGPSLRASTARRAEASRCTATEPTGPSTASGSCPAVRSSWSTADASSASSRPPRRAGRLRGHRVPGPRSCPD